MVDSASVVRGYICEMWGTGNTDLVDTYVHEHYTADGVEVGREFVRRNMLRFRDGFPDHTVEILQLIVEDDQAAALVRHSGTHLGAFGGMDATGRRMSMLESGFFLVQDGRVISAEWVADGLSLRMQLGYLGDDFWANPRSIPADSEIPRLQVS